MVEVFNDLLVWGVPELDFMQKLTNMHILNVYMFLYIDHTPVRFNMHKKRKAM